MTFASGGTGPLRDLYLRELYDNQCPLMRMMRADLRLGVIGVLMI